MVLGNIIPKNNLDVALKAFIAAENRKVHIVTKEIPYEIVLSKDKTLIT